MNRKLKRLSLLVAATSSLLLAFPNRTLAQTPLFNPQTEYVAGSQQGPSNIVVGDFNGDGKPDLAVANFGDWNVYVLLGNGDGTFQVARSVYFNGGGARFWYIAEGDFNGDGKLDLAVTDYSNNNVSVLLGNGDGTFQAPRTFPVGIHPAQVAVGDFNGDGKPDLVASNVDSNTISVLLGNGDGTFQAAQSLPVGLNPWYFAVGDFNSDGMLDLAVADYGCSQECHPSPSNTVLVLLGNGDGTFRPAPNLTVGNGPAGVAVADLNGDGKPDLVVANFDDNTLSVLLGNGDGTFQAAQNYLVDSAPVFVAVGDLNGDGKPDLAVADLHTFNISVLINNSGGSPVVATPTFSPGGGTYTGSVTVIISDAISGATIYYTTDGSTPTTSSAVYTGALTFTQTTTLKAMAAASGMTNSAVASATYTIQQQQVATPTFSPGGGTYAGLVAVTISDATSGATIYYTTDGSTPTTSSAVYIGPLTFTQTTTRKAMAAATGMTNSGVASATYTVQQPVATPTFSPGGGTYPGSVTVSISDASSGATIYYTTDGSTPTTSSAVYTGALTFTQTTTLKAMAAASGMTNSGVASATYTVQQPVATPTFSPGGGTYTGSVTVSINDASSGATIYYTTNGSTPTTSSAVYSGALTFTQTTTLKAMAAASGMTNSGVASATYTVQQQSFTLTVSKTDLGGGTVTSSPAGINCGSTCSATYVSGTTVTLTATPDLLSGFGGWSGCDSVSGNTCTVDMISARSVTADFRLLGIL